MPDTDRTPIGTPCWVDLATSDVDAARTFYEGVLGWTAAPVNPDFGGYFMFLRDGMPVAGATPNMSSGEVPDGWTTYMSTENTVKTLSLAVQYSGHLAAEPMAVADLGTMASLIDSTGATVSLWQAETFPGFAPSDAVGAAVYFELLAHDYSKAVAFYQAVFDWETEVISDTDEFRYTIASRDGTNVAGIMDAKATLDEGMPSHWLVYFAVPDTDRAIDAVLVGGGSVIAEPQDSPYGRFATVADASGVRFRIIAR